MNCFVFFFFNDTAPTEIYTLSLHDALPISSRTRRTRRARCCGTCAGAGPTRSEEHTSELQSLAYLVCRLLLEKKKILTNPGVISPSDICSSTVNNPITLTSTLHMHMLMHVC